jgi:RND family efflux transporter MFP subunit
VKVGQEAGLLVRNYSGRTFNGKVARTSGAVDPNTRTMRVEVDVPNEKGELFPGMYGQVKFKIQQARPSPLVPTSALVFGTDGMRVATIEDGTRIKMKKVTVGRDFGSEAEIADGLTLDDSIVTNPGERLVDGVEVQVRSSEKREAPALQASAR